MNRFQPKPFTLNELEVIKVMCKDGYSITDITRRLMRNMERVSDWIKLFESRNEIPNYKEKQRQMIKIKKLLSRPPKTLLERFMGR